MSKQEENKYVLAMYDIRSKQEFIYKSTHMKEIVGASLLIRDCYREFLYPAAMKISEKGIYGLYDMKDENKTPHPFTREAFKRHLEEGYIGEVVYDGGGNFLVLYKDEESYREVNKRFYYNVLRGTYSMRVLSTHIVGVDFDHYEKDRKRLYDRHRINEQEECVIHPVNALPIVQVDYQSSLPLCRNYTSGMFKKGFKSNKDTVWEKVSYESYQKYEKYEREMNRTGGEDAKIQGAKILDELITQKGEDSHLAVIYIDGNGMGAKVEACTKGKESYEDSVAALREFSAKIQKHYIDDRIKSIDDALADIDETGTEENAGRKRRRFVVYAGDEVTFICNASQAYRIVERYLTELEGVEEFKHRKDGKEEVVVPTSCAGISIFHSHAPFADAYRIAEECCETGKKYMRQRNINASFMDYHYCQGAIGTSLEDIRKHEGTERNSRPWRVETGQASCPDDSISTEILKLMAAELKKAGRSNIKGLAVAAKKSKADFQKELSRILAHYDEKKEGEKLDFSLNGNIKEVEKQQLIYDLVLVYDLWKADLTKEDSDTKQADVG